MASRYTHNQQGRERTSLFEEHKRVSSPYEHVSRDFSESQLRSMESQNEEETNTMFTKIQALKDLSLKMGDEIRGSNKTLEDLGNTFDQVSVKLKGTFSRMMVMAQRSGIPLKTWAILFLLVILFFFWVWIS